MKASLLVRFGLLLGFLCSGSISAQETFRVEEVARGFGVPWGMAFVAPKQLLITERSGRISLLELDRGTRLAITGVPEVQVAGQGGLLDVAVAPDYRPGGWIYFTYVKAVDGEGVTTLARAKLQTQRLEQWQELLVSQSRSGTSRHFGSRIAFDDQGFVYFGIGDRGERPNGQDLGNHAGSILRLQRDGQVPADNPFSGDTSALAEIWSYGHRNPQGLVFDPNKRRLWAIEHGPRGGDELNLVTAGANYGWPVISYGKEYWGPFAVGEGTEREGMVQPVKYYVPSIAPGSLLYYDGEAFPAWRGNLFAGALALRHLNRIVLDENGRAVGEERLLENLNERMRALAQGPKGWIYLSTDSGRILRLRPN